MAAWAGVGRQREKLPEQLQKQTLCLVAEARSRRPNLSNPLLAIVNVNEYFIVLFLVLQIDNRCPF